MNRTQAFHHVKDFFTRRNSLIRAVSAFLISLILIIWPKILSKTFVIVLGALMLAYCIYLIIRKVLLCKKSLKDSGEAMDLNVIIKRIPIISYILFISGLLFIIFPEFFMTILMIIFGIALIISSLIQLWACISYIDKPQEEDKAKQSEGVVKWVFLALPVVSIILGIVILCNPFETVTGLLIFTGIALMYYGITEIARIIYFRSIGEEVPVKENKELVEIE